MASNIMFLTHECNIVQANTVRAEIKLTSSLPSVRHVFIASAQLAAMSRRKGKKSIKISSKTNISFEID
jgi:hypothetical protein